MITALVRTLPSSTYTIYFFMPCHCSVCVFKVGDIVPHMQFCISYTSGMHNIEKLPLVLLFLTSYSFLNPQQFGVGIAVAPRIGNHGVFFFFLTPQIWKQVMCCAWSTYYICEPSSNHHALYTSTQAFIFQGELILQAFSVPSDFSVGSILSCYCPLFKDYLCSVWCYFFPQCLDQD